MRSGHPHDRTRRTMVALATALLTFGTLAAYLDRNVLDAGGFSDNVAEAISSDAVSGRIAETVTNGLVAQDPKLLSVQPVIDAAAKDALGSSVVDGLIRSAAAETHSALFSTDQESIVIDLANVGVIATKLISAQDPSLGKRLRSHSSVLGKIADRGFAAGLVRVANDVKFVAIVFPLLALVLLAAAVWIGPRRRAVAGIGVSLMTAAALSFIAGASLQTVVLLSTQPENRDLVNAVLHAFMSELAVWALVLGFAGAVIAAAASSLEAAADVSALPRRLWARVSAQPRRALPRTARAIAFVVAGALTIAQPVLVLTIIAVAAGAWAIYVGLTELLILLVRPSTEAAPRPEGTARVAGRRIVAWGFGTAAAIGLVAAIAALALSGRGEATAVAATDSSACNGHVALCDRPLNRVALATVHNASSAAPYGVLNANSDLSLTGQLDRGYRGFLIDALTASPNDQGTIRTEITGKTRAILRKEVGTQGVRSAQALADRFTSGAGNGTTEPYLCHVLCELGAVRMVDGLREVSDWIDSNPRNVIVLFIQDDVTPAAAEQAFSDAGLLDRISDYDPDSGRPWPTLAEMIDSGRNVFVMAENEGEPTGWYHQGFPTITQDTPYANPTVASLQRPASCRLYRGRPDSPLFLINSWVDTYPPNPDNAMKVNQPKFLGERVDRCRRLRGRFPNLVAVDFPGQGDPIKVVDELNRVDGPRSQGGPIR